MLYCHVYFRKADIEEWSTFGGEGISLTPRYAFGLWFRYQSLG